MKTENKIPLKEDNPKGLHAKYLIKKFSHMKEVGWLTDEPVFVDVDPGSEYFVLRLYDKQKDQKHRQACITALLAYAKAIKDHLPELSKDLIERYGSAQKGEGE